MDSPLGKSKFDAFSLTDRTLSKLVYPPDFTLLNFSNALKICHPQS